MKLLLFVFISFIYQVVIINARTISFKDEDIKYFGRWQKTATDIQSVSSGAYLKTTIIIDEQQQRQIKLKLSRPATVYSQIHKVGSIIKLEAIDQGTYPIDLVINIPSNITSKISTTLLIMSDISSTICLQAIEINDFTSSSILSKEDIPSSPLIEYVGHDLTLGLGTSNSIMTSFPWVVSNLLGTERSQIAFPGAWLMNHETYSGMETKYFEGTSFYSPQIIVILLGRYDQYKTEYTSRLSNFLSSIKSRFPKSIIFVLSEPLGVLFQESQTAVNYLNDVKSDQNVYFIDTTSWVQYGSTFYTDYLHLNDKGQEKLAHKLSPLLMAKLNRQPFPGPQPNPNLPYSWQTTDIGSEDSIGLIGSVSFDSSKTFTLWGSGKGFLTQDAFRFVYQSLSGDGSIQATIESHSAFSSCAKAGIILREHLGPSSAHIMLGLSPQDGLFLQSRTYNLQDSQTIKKKKLSPPYRLRLTRQTSTTTIVVQIASISDNSWETFSIIKNVTFMARDIYVGLAVTSCDPKVVSVAKFSDVTLSGGVGGGGFYYQEKV